MEVKAGYKQTEVGVIPEEWKVSSIGALCSAVLDCHHSTPVWTASGSVVIRNQNIKDGKLDLSQPSFTDEIHFVERTRRAVPSFGDLVITREAPMGLVCMIPDGLKCCLGQRMVLLRPSHVAVETEYLLYALLSKPVQRSISVGGGTGSTVSNLRIPVLKGLEISVPPITEQRAIATALSDMDDLISGLDHLIAKKRDIKQAAMQQLLTGRIRFPGFSEAWDEKRLGDVARLYQSETISQNVFSETGFPVYGANGEIGKYFRYNHELPQITISCRGNCGTVNRTPGRSWITGNAMVVNIESSPFIDFEFFFQLLNFQDFSVIVSGSGQPQIVRGPLSAFQVRIPQSKAEQEAIASVLSEMDAEIEALEVRREKFNKLKKGMMQELLTGRIRLV